ncbi:MAG: DNA translocase FtsK 4TM domain-containing protein, partial [Synergistaceae bacterium]|nr:DNA translocase FtsK 4TM domain-containing protein [Synergistaceae bacterium]
MIFGKKDKRDRKPSANQPKSKAKAASSGAWTRLLYIVMALASLYLTASFYTPWTGTLGQRISSSVLQSAGGGAIILILFALYFSISRLLSRKIPNLIRQSAGTLLVFLTASLLLGLNIMTSDHAEYPVWLSPGTFGKSFAEQVFSMLGAFGTFIGGALFLYISILLFNIPLLSNIKLPGSSLLTFFSRKGNNSLEDAQEKTSPDDTINISEYDGADYFGSAGGEDIDQPPITVTGLGMSGTEESSYSSEVIQDPEFNLDEDPLYDGVEQGVFPPPIEIFGNEESREGEMDEEKSMPLGDKIIKTLK